MFQVVAYTIFVYLIEHLSFFSRFLVIGAVVLLFFVF